MLGLAGSGGAPWQAESGREARQPEHMRVRLAGAADGHAVILRQSVTHASKRPSVAACGSIWFCRLKRRRDVHKTLQACSAPTCDRDTIGPDSDRYQARSASLAVRETLRHGSPPWRQRLGLALPCGKSHVYCFTPEAKQNTTKACLRHGCHVDMLMCS